jgi:hypothetical protein
MSDRFVLELLVLFGGPAIFAAWVVWDGRRQKREMERLKAWSRRIHARPRHIPSSFETWLRAQYEREDQAKAAREAQ